MGKLQILARIAVCFHHLWSSFQPYPVSTPLLIKPAVLLITVEVQRGTRRTWKKAILFFGCTKTL